MLQRTRICVSARARTRGAYSHARLTVRCHRLLAGGRLRLVVVLVPAPLILSLAQPAPAHCRMLTRRPGQLPAVGLRPGAAARERPCRSCSWGQVCWRLAVRSLRPLPRAATSEDLLLGQKPGDASSRARACMAEQACSQPVCQPWHTLQTALHDSNRHLAEWNCGLPAAPAAGAGCPQGRSGGPQASIRTRRCAPGSQAATGVRA